MTRESVIQADIRRTLGCRPDVMLIRVNVGLFLSLDGKRKVKSAPNGTPDLLGLLKLDRGALPLAIETKTKDGKLSEDQKSFQRVWSGMGGLYIVGRSVSQVESDLQEAKHAYRSG